MNIAILGGSFNPPHICHVFILHYVLMTTDVEQLWLLPCYHHAFEKSLAPFQHRFEMCSLAVESFQEGFVQVLPFEKERKSPSWTVDTVRYVKDRFPDHTFSWIIGSDVLSELHKWKDFEQLQQLISFLVVPRAGNRGTRITTTVDVTDRRQPAGLVCQQAAGDPTRVPKVSETIRTLEKQCQELEQQGVQLPAVSSSLIRERVKQQLPIRHLVSQKVEKYIDKHGLYRS